MTSNKLEKKFSINARIIYIILTQTVHNFCAQVLSNMQNIMKYITNLFLIKIVH